MKQLSLDFEGPQSWCYECTDGTPNIFKPLCKKHLEELDELFEEGLKPPLRKGGVILKPT